MWACVCVCVCVCASACVCVQAHVCVCVRPCLGILTQGPHSAQLKERATGAVKGVLFIIKMLGECARAGVLLT